MLSLGASSLLSPPEDLSTVEELQARLRRLPLHPTTTVSVWPCAVAVCAVYRGPFRPADLSHIAPTPVAA